MQDNPIIILEQDEDDREMISHAMKALRHRNELVFLESGDDVIKYLKAAEKG